jgi:hypothetical protein
VGDRGCLFGFTPRYDLKRVTLRRALPLIWLVGLVSHGVRGAETVSHPFSGITVIRRTEGLPRPVVVHLVKIVLATPGISFQLTPSKRGRRETVRQTTLDYLNERHAQLAVNAHFFVPFPTADPDSDLVGLAASGGDVYSGFETAAQAYAIVADAPALNLDRSNRARIVHRDPGAAGGKAVQEQVSLWTAMAGSAQIVTRGAATIPIYRDGSNPQALLIPGGPGRYDTVRSWYAAPNARTIAGLDKSGETLFLFTVDNAAGSSRGMTVGEAAEMLVRDYGVHEAINLDGGGSTTLAIEDRETGTGRILNSPSGGGKGRAVGSNLAIFAKPSR